MELNDKMELNEKIILKVLKEKFNNNEKFIDEAIHIAKSLTKQFKAFIDYYNTVNSTAFEPCEAWDNIVLNRMFAEMTKCVYNSNRSINVKAFYPDKYISKSTKALSYNSVNKEGTRRTILQEMKLKDQPLTRKEISRLTNLPLETVTGQIPPLKELNLVSLHGYTVDKETNKKVEQLVINKDTIKYHNIEL